MIGRRLTLPLAIAILLIAGPAAASAHARPHLRACGVVQTPELNTGTKEIFAVSRVSALRLSCAPARGLVRRWHHLSIEAKLSNASAGKVRKGVLVYNRWGKPYRVSDFVCRSMAVAGPGPIEVERVTCGSHTGLVTWAESGRYGSL